MIYNFNTLVDAQPKVIAAIIENKGHYKILNDDMNENKPSIRTECDACDSATDS